MKHPRYLFLATNLLLLASVMVSIAPAFAAMQRETSAADLQALSLNDDYGIDHISYGDGTFAQNRQVRYNHALQAGVGWNRWVLYWNEIERTSGVYDFSKPEATLTADRAQGLKVLGILFGTPDYASPAVTKLSGDIPAPSPRVGQKGFYDEQTRLSEAATGPGTTTYPPIGFDQPIFADGTDTPGPGKAINPNNPWARYTYESASRFKGRIQAWEIWNEPDLAPTSANGWFGFWAGTIDQYVRMLKVAYISIKVANPEATVVMGGLAYWQQQDYFPKFLTALKRDAQAAANSYYFDVSAWHWYSQAGQLYFQTLWAREEMAKVGINNKAIWITETNIPVCGDPGITDKLDCQVGTHRGPIDKQAAYMFQALAYARAAGVQKVFLFQLYDDGLGYGNYYGLVRNSGSPRPALAALQYATTYFRDVVQAYRTVSNNGAAELITLVRSDGSKVRIAWNQSATGFTIAVPIDGTEPKMIEQTGVTRTVSTQQGGFYLFFLPGATLNDDPFGFNAIVGGTPYIFVEDNSRLDPSTITGAIRDGAGRPLAGIPLRVGEQTLQSDSQGRYSVTIPSGLYDVGVSGSSPFQSLSNMALSTPVGSGSTAIKDFSVKTSSARFFPILPFQGSPKSP